MGRRNNHRKSSRPLLVCLLLALILIALDQWTKHLAVVHLQTGSIPIIDGIFRLQYCENTGTGFSMFAGKLPFIIGINCLILLVIGYWLSVMPRGKRYVPMYLVLTGIVSGALGNMIDRVRCGYVVDFLYFEWIDFPIFNVADIYVTVSVVMMALLLFYYSEDEVERILSFRRTQTQRSQKKVADTEEKEQ